MTQDVEQGQFTITVDNPIPLMPYSDRFTSAKYGHHILYSGIIPTNNSVAEVDKANQTNSYPLVASFMREHSLYNPAHDSNFNFDQLRLYKGWCAFFHNEHTKNLMCVLEAIARNIYGPNDTIPHRYLKAFSLDHEDIKSLVERRAENKSSTKLYRFNLRSHDSEDMIIGEGIGSRPLQYSLGKLHTMTSIIEKQGSGWDKINAKDFFKCSEVYRREDVDMSTNKEYEECNIMFSTP